MERVSLRQRFMIKELQHHPEINGQLGTVVQAVGITCTETESARVAVSYTCAAVTSVPAPAAVRHSLDGFVDHVHLARLAQRRLRSGSRAQC